MRRSLVEAIVLGFVLLGCDASRAPSSAPSSPSAVPSAAATVAPTTTEPTSPPPSSTAPPPVACSDEDAGATRVVYSDADDLWLYDLASDGRRRITADAAAHFEHDPRFVTAGCIVHVDSESRTIALRDLALDGASRVIVQEPAGGITSLDVSPDGRSIAYLHVDHDVDGAYRLKLVDIDTGVPVVAHVFHPALGRGAGSEDEVSVAWAPDGSAILVANTHEFTEQDPTGALYLFDRTGRQILAKWPGTHPRWAPDGRSVYFRGYAGGVGQGWSTLDVETLRTTSLGIRPGTNNLVVSPDGRHVAYDTSWFGDLPGGATWAIAAPKVYAFDLSTGEETLLGDGALGPLWISSTAVIATDGGAPEPDTMQSWTSLGTVTEIALDGERRLLDMTSTLFSATVHLGR